jgi:hypothetical protein
VILPIFVASVTSFGLGPVFFAVGPLCPPGGRPTARFGAVISSIADIKPPDSVVDMLQLPLHHWVCQAKITVMERLKFPSPSNRFKMQEVVNL